MLLKLHGNEEELGGMDSVEVSELVLPMSSIPFCLVVKLVRKLIFNFVIF